MWRLQPGVLGYESLDDENVKRSVWLFGGKLPFLSLVEERMARFYCLGGGYAFVFWVARSC